MHRAADVRDGVPGALREVGKQGVCGRIVGEAVAGGLDLEREGGELGTDAVVQVAPEASPLLPRRHEALALALEIRGEPDGVGCDADLAGEVLEQPQVGLRERLPLRSGGEHEPADGLVLVG